MILELVIHCVIPPPKNQGKICYYVMARIVCNPYDDIVMVIAILRLYQVV